MIPVSTPNTVESRNHDHLAIMSITGGRRLAGTTAVKVPRMEVTKPHDERWRLLLRCQVFSLGLVFGTIRRPLFTSKFPRRRSWPNDPCSLVQLLEDCSRLKLIPYHGTGFLDFCSRCHTFSNLYTYFQTLDITLCQSCSMAWEDTVLENDIWLSLKTSCLSIGFLDILFESSKRSSPAGSAGLLLDFYYGGANVVTEQILSQSQILQILALTSNHRITTNRAETSSCRASVSPFITVGLTSSG